MQYSDNQKKFAAVINKKCDAAVVMNALAHASLGLGEAKPDAAFLTYDRPDLVRHANISTYPVITFSAKNSNQIRRLVQEANDAGLDHNYFTEQMIAGSAQEQIDANRDTAWDDLTFVCAVLFGDREKVDPLTKRFSLFKSL